MPKKAKSRSLKLKLLFLILFGMLIPTGVLLGGYFYSINEVRTTSERVYNKLIIDQVKSGLKFIVESTVSSIQGEYGEQAIGDSDVIRLLKMELDNIRYGDSGYFFAFQYDGIRLVSPENREQEGQNLWDFTDPSGKKPIQEFIATAKSGGGYVSYIWLNPTTQKQEEKISYVAPLKINNTELVVGTGEYYPALEIAKREVGKIFDENQAKVAVLALSISGIAILLVLFFVYIYISKRVSRPIDSVVKNIKQMSAGDFTGFIKVASNDEIGEMAMELKKMGASLTDLISQVLYSSGRVEGTAEEIASGNQDLSRRTQEQASTLEEVAATIEEVNASIQITTSNSERANLLSRSTLDEVNAGQESIQETLDAMNQISASSQQIVEIIRVVNDIAFQTNLLALNAAVEAARAGEQGRGFAVVAAEVRNLAGRVSEASKEIENLIKESAERVERGNSLVQHSAELLGRIVENTKKTVAVINDVASTMKEQASAGEQIQVSIDQLNQVTQQNAAMVEEMAASSMLLSSEAGNLNRIVNRFHLSQSQPEKKVAPSSPEPAVVPEPKPDPAIPKDFIGDSWEKF